MVYDYGYGELGNQLINLFHSGAPDFEAAEALIRQGADLNAVGNDPEENILSEILMGYLDSKHGDADDNYKRSHDLNPDAGPAMCRIIHFFLDHGFDVTQQNDCFGAQCLWALTMSTYDRYMIEAAKILLDAGAKNRSTSPFPADHASAPWEFTADESSFQATCMQDYAAANLYEAVCQIYQAIEDGRPYSGIDSYEAALGKKLLRILAKCRRTAPIESLDLLHPQKKHLTENLYFVYDSGVLIVTPNYDLWTDTILPDAELTDVSSCFKGMIGGTIQNIAFDVRSFVRWSVRKKHRIEQVTSTITMDTGRKLKLISEFETNKTTSWISME